MRRFLRNNGLTLVLMLATIASIAGMLASGWDVDSEERLRHGHAALPLLQYAGSGAFLSALFENWESEFLQMAAYVVLTAYLYQKGSAESKDPDAPDEAEAAEPEAGSPIRRSDRLARWLYAHSLGLALGILFLLSFALHLAGSASAEADEALQHGETAGGLIDHLGTAGFWFESFQNWQSEFLSTAVVVVLSIFLRYRGSPESKPVDAPDSQTGS